MKKYAIGIVCQNRWELTQQTLTSIYYSTQDKDSYDIFLIDNGSDAVNVNNLREFIKSKMLPIKNAFFIPKKQICEAWNLFLSFSQDYQFRVKYDNDLILPATIKSVETVSPTGFGPELINPGAPASSPASLRVGAQRSKAKQKNNQINKSNFLDYMSTVLVDANADIIALAPISPGESFQGMLYQMSTRRINGLPYLFGACMMISKKCFDTIGYFDERLPRMLDTEYTQRAIRNNLNIGYHPEYWVIHKGAGKSTEMGDVEKKTKTALKIISTTPLSCKADTKWAYALQYIDEVAKQHVCVNMTKK